MLIFAIKTKQTIKFEPIRNPLEPFLESLRIIHVKKRIRKDWAAASAQFFRLVFTFLLFFSVSSFRCSLRVLGCRRPPLMSEQMIGRLVPPIRDAFPHVVKHKNQKSREKSHSSNRQRAHLQIIPRRLCHQYTILLLKNDSEMCLSNMFSVQFEDAISGGYFMAFFRNYDDLQT